MAMAETKNSAGSANIAAGLREAVYAAVIAFFMFVLFIGVKTEQNIHNADRKSVV